MKSILAMSLDDYRALSWFVLVFGGGAVVVCFVLPFLADLLAAANRARHRLEDDERKEAEEAARAESPACTPDVCAWCNPGDRNASGVCPHHKTELVEQARECARQNGGVL